MTSSRRTELGLALYRFRKIFYSLAAFSCVINILGLAPALYMLQVYDRVLTSTNETTLLMLTILVVGLFLLSALLELARSQVLIRVGNRFDMILNQRIFTASFERNLRRSGGNPAQAVQDLTNLRQFLAGNALIAFFDAPWTPVYIAVTFMVHPLLGLITLGGSITLIVLACITNAITQKPLAEANQASISAAAFANNHLRNAEVIEAMGMLPGLRARWFGQHSRVLALQTQASDRNARISTISRFVRITLQSIVLGVGALLVIDGSITAGMMIVCSILMGKALGPVEQAIGAWRQMLNTRQAYARLDEILKEAPQRGDTLSLPAPQGHIRLENVFAGAPGGQSAIIKGLSFDIPAGDAVGVIGPSAAGKSTLARVLVGIWPSRAGTVRLDGADVYLWNKDELGPHVGYLPQDIELFEGSIAENIARFGAMNDEQVIEAAQRAGVHDMILHLPQGYDTRLGTDGASLSGGQKQRIALARAMYGNPALLVLDEPNSNLDESGEAALVQAIADMKRRGSTVVLITHRMNVLNAMDKLLVMRDGALAMYGPRGDVLDALHPKQIKTATQAEQGRSPGADPDGQYQITAPLHAIRANRT
ncbi:type I secretion system permease/ATPase [Pollutimonas sp. M17]|uniref:type I secretion system permease/ATPase n=1 Tax=Pollutimonas sp. M17 TaxID=2962065 RepID=UPI0021F48608|nr:type I secretion system permease/ATPase [Pollutimonas sp. M17]UYO92784.1 type I secretion system permease/ATPase [Pollutimonas sp. M17]